MTQWQKKCFCTTLNKLFHDSIHLQLSFYLNFTTSRFRDCYTQELELHLNCHSSYEEPYEGHERLVYLKIKTSKIVHNSRKSCVFPNPPTNTHTVLSHTWEETRAQQQDVYSYVPINLFGLTIRDVDEIYFLINFINKKFKRLK